MYVLLNTKHFVNGHIQNVQNSEQYICLSLEPHRHTHNWPLWMVFSDVLSIPKNHPSPSCPRALVHLSVLLPWLICPLLTSPTAAATAAAEDEDKQQDEDDQSSTESPHDVVELRIIRTKTKDTHSIRWGGGGGGGGGGRRGGGRRGGRQ